MRSILLSVLLSCAAGSLISQHVLSKEAAIGDYATHSAPHRCDENSDPTNDTLRILYNRGSSDYDPDTNRFTGYLDEAKIGKSLFFW